MRMWIIEPNNPEDWDHQLITIRDGKRDSHDFIKSCIKNKVVSSSNVNNNEESLNIIIQKLNLDRTKMANTITLFEDSSSIIQFCYHQDFIECNSKNLEGKYYNYFASIINNEISNIFGNAVFFEINKDNNQLNDLDPTKLFNFLANLHFVKTYQVRNGDLQEIAFPNIKGIIHSALKDKTFHSIQNWEFYMSKNSNGDITDLGIEPVDINNYNDLIIFKQKPQHEVTSQLIDEGKINIEENTIKGYYDDVDIKYIENFFNSYSK